MNLIWVSDPTGLNHETAGVGAVDLCAQGQSVQPVETPAPGDPLFTVLCMKASKMAQDLYARVRLLAGDTCFVRIYLTQAKAEANPGGADLVGSSTAVIGAELMTDPYDFTIVNGPAGPDLTGWHLATVPFNVTPANPLDSVYKLEATATQQAATSDFMTSEMSIQGTDLTHNSPFRAISDTPTAEWGNIKGTKPKITVRAEELPESTTAVSIEDVAYTIVSRQPSIDGEFVELELEPENTSEIL